MVILHVKAGQAKILNARERGRGEDSLEWNVKAIAPISPQSIYIRSDS